MRRAAVRMRAASPSSSDQVERSGNEMAAVHGHRGASLEPADCTEASDQEEASPVNLHDDDDGEGRAQLRALLLAAIQEHRSAFRGGWWGVGARKAETASWRGGDPAKGGEAQSEGRSSETRPDAGRQLMVHLAQLHGTQLEGHPPPPAQGGSASSGAAAVVLVVPLGGSERTRHATQLRGLPPPPPAPGGSDTTATAASRPGGRTTALLSIGEWVLLLRGLTRGGVVVEAAEEASGDGGGGDIKGGDGGAGGTLHPVAEEGGWVSACEALLEVMQSDTELQFRGGSGSSGRRADDDGRGSPRENDDGRGRGSRREDDDSAAAERLSGLIVAASGLLRILFLARKEEQSRGGSPLESSHSTLKTPRSGIPLLHQQQKDSLLLLQQRRRRSQRRWMQLALSALRPHLFLLQPPMLLRLLRCLATGEGHPVGLPLLPANPAWMRTVYSCTADVHVPPAAAATRAVSSFSDADPGTAGSCTAYVDIQPPPSSSTTVSCCHMGLMNSLQLKRLMWALSKLSRGQSPPNDWKQVGGRGGSRLGARFRAIVWRNEKMRAFTWCLNVGREYLSRPPLPNSTIYPLLLVYHLRPWIDPNSRILPSS